MFSSYLTPADKATLSFLTPQQSKKLERVLKMVNGDIFDVEKLFGGSFEISIVITSEDNLSPKELVQLSKLVVDVSFDTREYGDIIVIIIIIK